MLDDLDWMDGQRKRGIKPQFLRLRDRVKDDPDKRTTRVVHGYAQSQMIFHIGDVDEPYSDQEGLIVLDRAKCKERGIRWRDVWDNIPDLMDDYQNWANGWTLRYEEHRLLRCNLGHIHAIPHRAASGKFYGIRAEDTTILHAAGISTPNDPARLDQQWRRLLTP